MPDFQASAMGNDRSPNIFTCQTLADFPRFVEEGDRAIGLDLANEMDPTSGNRQGIGQMRDLFGSQTMKSFATLRLLRRGIDQRRWYILVQIPMDEGWTAATNVGERVEVSALPERMAPQAIQFFDLAVVLGLCDRQEDQFDAQIQTQANELPENARCFVPATESCIVVELQKMRNSQGFPGLQAMFPDRFEAFVEGNGLCASARAQIQGMKGIDLETVFEIPARPIQRMQAARQHLQGFGKIHPFGRPGLAMQATLTAIRA